MFEGNIFIQEAMFSFGYFYVNVRSKLCIELRTLPVVAYQVTSHFHEFLAPQCISIEVGYPIFTEKHLCWSLLSIKLQV